MQRGLKLLLGGLALVSMSGAAMAHGGIDWGVSIAVPGVSTYVEAPPPVVYAAPPAVVYQEAPAPVYYSDPPQVYYAPPPPVYYGAPGVSVYYGPSSEEFRGDRRWHRHYDREDGDDDE